ncbi:hypothetical protein Hanom_Chr02g00177511 [Helianthus anomalus]
MWNLIYFQSITYFLYFFFSMCAFLKKTHAFLALCASPAPCVFDNIGLSKLHVYSMVVKIPTSV